MHKIINFRLQTAAIIALGLMLSCAVALFVSYMMLPLPPRTSYFSGVQLVLWFSFAGCVTFLLGLQTSRQKIATATFVSLAIFAIATMLGVQAIYPNYKTIAEARAFTEERTQAAQVGTSLAEEIKNENLDLASAQKATAAQFQNNQELENIAQQALVKAIEATDKSSTDIIQEVYPTIPLTLHIWNCTNAGCAYQDETYVWTISRGEQINGGALLGIGLFLICAIVGNELYKTKVNSRKVKS